MRIVIQRVAKASVKVNGEIIGQIGNGLLVLLAVHQDDEEKVIYKIADKVINLRIFEDEKGKINLSIKDVGGEIMVVSQFTLYGDYKKGNRPSFIESAKAEKAALYYEKFVKYLQQQGISVATGKFAAKMEVELINDGPDDYIRQLDKKW